MRLITLTIVALITSWSTAFAYTVETGFITFKQPNGVEFTGRQWGDAVEANSITDDGYAYIQEADAYYYYVELDDAGEFAATKYRVGIDDPKERGIPKGLNRSAERKAQISAARDRLKYGDRAVAGKAAAVLVAPPDEVTFALILVEFSDVKGGTLGKEPNYTCSDYNTMFFGTSYDNTDHPDGETVYGSIAAYWDQMEGNGNTVDITSSAVNGGPAGGVRNTCDGSDHPDWITLSGTKKSYHLGTKSAFISAAQTAAAPINTTESNTYKVVIIYAGNLYDKNFPGGCGNGGNDPDVTGCGLTAFTNGLGGDLYTFSELRDNNHATNERNCDDGVTPSPPYDCQQEMRFVHIGSHVHEVGHSFGLDHPHDGGGSGDVYFWSLMQSGDKGGPRIGSSPITLTPEEMIELEFATFTPITGRIDDLVVDAGTYYQFDYGTAGRFIIEHRNSGGSFNNYLWDDAWTGKGLLFWYTDEDGGNETDNQCLIAADGNPKFDNTMANDVFPGPLNKTSITDNTAVEVSNEATGITNGTNTRVALVNIQTVGSTTEVDVFDQNHYTDTPTATVIDDAETRKARINVTWQTTPSALVTTSIGVRRPTPIPILSR